MQQHSWAGPVYTLLYNDCIVNIYTIGRGTSFYNLLVPFHANALLTANELKLYK